MVTIFDVARHAGVSSSTVSFALVMPLHRGVYVPIVTEIAISVTTTARRHGYDVLLVTNDEGPEGVRRVAASGLADGVILMDVELDDQRIPALRAQGTQAVLIGLPDDPHGLSCVDHDFAAAGALCADHLADLDHREIAFIGYGSGVYQRHAGYAERTPHGLPRARRAARSALPRPTLRGHVRKHRRDPRPHPRRPPTHHRLRGAERGGDRPAAQSAAQQRAVRARGRLGGGINHTADAVPPPAPAHDLLTGTTAHELPPGGRAVLRGH